MLKILTLNSPNFPSDNGRFLTIGDFDGCHSGHQRLIQLNNQFADKLKISSTALSFNPSPKDFFNAKFDNIHLFTEEQKIRAFKELGLNECIIKKFDRDFSALTHEQFISEVLLKQIHASGIVIGENFKFGKNRLGTPEILRKFFKNNLHTVNLVSDSQNSVSSTNIRNFLLNGNVKSATKNLNRPYSIESKVIKGKQIGRTIGIPTANFGNPSQLIPKDGVYCGFVILWNDHEAPPTITNLNLQKTFPAVANIGLKPTINNNTLTANIEAHILDGDWHSSILYGLNIAFYFIDRIRDEQKFSSLDDLKAQITKDIEHAKIVLNNFNQQG